MNSTLAIIIAAGIGSRLQPLTDELPKCMLDVQGSTMILRAIETFKQSNLPRSVVIGGYKADRLELPTETTIVMNHEYRNNNILHSLACAREQMKGEGTVLISYSDIIFQTSVVDRFLKDEENDISIVVDQNWPTRYHGRLLHPLAQAEAVKFDSKRVLQEAGKDLLTEEHDPQYWGEFIGMMKMTPKGRDLFWGIFDEVDSKLAAEDPFQQAPEWQRAYITDMLQELVARNIEVRCFLIQGGWLEIDTTEDYESAATFNF